MYPQIIHITPSYLDRKLWNLRGKSALYTAQKEHWIYFP